jgi:shikimate dehydrogenase
MRLFGLIGFPLSHSFSKQYFTEKFELEQIKDARYELFPLEDIADFPQLLADNPTLVGLNVTIPHKQAVIPYLTRLGESARKVGAVNVIKIARNGETITTTGYNTDYYGFLQSLARRLNAFATTQNLSGYKALVLGNGGASQAVQAALRDLQIDFKIVVRNPDTEGALLYENLNEEIMRAHLLIVNTTPLGTSPNVQDCSPIPYEYLSNQHFLYDLVYNPAETNFMQQGKAKGADVKNGLEMLHLQAEKAWEIFTAH